MSYSLFCTESKKSISFGGVALFTCGHSSKELKILNSKLHLQYLLMVDTHIAKTNNPGSVYQVNEFLFDNVVNVYHPNQGQVFPLYKNVRDYIFKPVFSATYVELPFDLIKETLELFKFWLNA